MNLREYPKKVILAGGEEVILRPMVQKDEKALLDFFRGLSEKDRLYLRDDVTNSSLIRYWAQNINYDLVLPILAFAGEAMVGDATLHRNINGWQRHVGKVRIVVHHDYRRKGLARVLAAELIQHALAAKLLKIVAEVVADQHGAREVFYHLGFRDEAVLKNHVLDSHGEKHDLLILSEDIDNLWRRWRDFVESASCSQPMED